MGARLRTWLAAMTGRRRWEDELAEELESHVQLRADALVAAGAARGAAVRQARLELGAREAHREDARRSFGLRWVDELRQDVRYTLRAFRRNPGFVAVAVASLGLGVGANIVVFGVLNTMILRRPPVADAERVHFLQASTGPTLSFPNYRDLRDRNRSFTALAAFRFTTMGVGVDDGTERVWGYLASGSYFDLLGIRPALGRFFGPETDVAAGAAPVVVLSHDAWRHRFGADSGIVGASFRINGRAYEVVGVAPEGFRGTEILYRPEVWVPIAMQAEIEGWSWLEARETQNTMVVGRRRAGLTVEQAEAELDALALELGRDHPTSNGGLRLRLTEPGLFGDFGRSPARAFLGGVMVLALAVLLAAVVNLASLLVARTADRSREIALRLSIGAGPARVFRQLTTETVLLALAGGAAGWLLADTALAALSAWRLPLGVPLQLSVEPDLRVLGFALGATLLVGLSAGFAAARQAARVDLGTALKDAPGWRGARRWPARELLLAVQVALATVLLTATAASIRGLAQAFRTPVGFQPAGLAVAAFDLGLEPRTAAQGRAAQRRVLDAVRALPGVESAAFAGSMPLTTDHSSTAVFRDDEVDFTADRAIHASTFEVSPGYFRTVAMPLVAGRELAWDDDADAPPVAVVNQTFARRVFGSEEVLGRRFRYGPDGDPVTVVGLAADGKYVTLSERPRPAVFRAAGQVYSATTVVLARTAVPEAVMADRMRRLAGELEPRAPVYEAGPAIELLQGAFLPARIASVALGAFGALAVMLAVTGIYGMATYLVSRRAREIGVRMALGARPAQVLGFTFGRTGLVLALGAAAGLGLSAIAARVLARVVYQASPTDPQVLLLTAIGVALVGVLSAAQPARRALSVDPLRALRSD